MNDGYGLEPSDPYYLIEVFQLSTRMNFRNGTIHDWFISHGWSRDTHDTWSALCWLFSFCPTTVFLMTLV
jgi:hypothetical protein